MSKPILDIFQIKLFTVFTVDYLLRVVVGCKGSKFLAINNNFFLIFASQTK
ncbi:MAG: hypothetical protein AAGF83_21610 [Cyanobacteria bacterium P01_G01_bin.67]